MIGLVLISHGPLAGGFRDAAEMIMGTQEALAVLGLEPAQDMDRFQADLTAAVGSVDRGSGVLILADLFGGSPANTSAYLLGPSVEVVCGLSLPMLLEVLGFREQGTLTDLALLAVAAGAEAAVRLADKLAQQ
ncbi:MAG: system mannose/fructose-specific component [Firmicutes bacterium]|nr:system mannose/fructose-specific component [Bacillota bacterium]